MSAAVAALLNDFAHRDAALDLLKKADQSNPLAEMVSVFADPQYSMLRPDGALYVADSQNHRVQKLVRAK